MKIQSIRLVLGFLLCLSGFLSAQKAITDTLSYAKKFELNKDKYIGKPFSRLLKDMEQMQPKMAKSAFNDNPNNPMSSTIFRFSEKDIAREKEVTLLIKWKADELPNTPIQFFEEEHNYRFTVSERNFFEKKVVKDIFVYK